mmetsp:Transcript_4397/g.9796  ORF Transcript_4397/g.9796 Transcript_4397/m.9796 type:complete len:203 (+) Transcript_4397:111-719(+)
MFLKTVALFAIVGTSQAWVAPVAPTTRTNNVALSAHSDEPVSSRKEFMSIIVKSAAAAAVAESLPMAAMAEEDVVKMSNGVVYKIKKSGDGAKPDVGELAAIRFAAYCNDFKIDDIFDTPEPYYTRVGSGGLIKGVEAALPGMRVGDRWELTIPGDLAFGSKGRPASAGKPRIPGGATIVFDVEMVGLPGKEQELIELIGDV